jgi:hypothetical protein
MKFTNLIALILLFNVFGCRQKNIEINSFNDKWGVCFYISPRYVQDGCSYRGFFFPLKSAADSSLISKKSSPFDFSYEPGIRFNTYNSNFLRQLYYTNPLPGNIHEIQDDKHIIHWVFMKLRFKKNSQYGILPVTTYRCRKI